MRINFYIFITISAKCKNNKKTNYKNFEKIYKEIIEYLWKLINCDF